jgi:L-asparaginase
VTDRRRVAVVFTGGTISMRFDAAAGGAVPVLDGAAILAQTRGLDEIADVEAIDWGLVPASHLSFAQLLDLARTVRGALDQPEIDGAVVVQGTDVIEETAFALDLLTPGDKPVVVTGAMRNAGEDGYDGPTNLRGAIRTAAHLGMAGQGAVVALDGAILPADDATKTHTDAYGTFRALNIGPVGAVSGDGVVITARRAARRTLPVIPDVAVEPIPIVTAAVATDGWPLRVFRDAGARGFVVAATGAGNTHPDLLAAAQEAMTDGLPVVVTTRAASGRARPAYAFAGGGVGWARAGAMFAGYLGAPKARIALALGMGAGLDEVALRALLTGP